MIALACACATPAATRAPAPKTVGVDVDGPEAQRFEPFVAPAIDAIEARGLRLREQTHLHTHATLDEFLAATSTDPEEPLRAWTRYVDVDLTPLATWQQPTKTFIATRLTHELCHAALYQAFGSEARARTAKVPRFFAEGACMIISRQSPGRFIDDDVDALGADTFHVDPMRAYLASYQIMHAVEEKLGPRAFADIVAAAAVDGRAGCVERALEHKLGMTIPALWQAVLDEHASKS